MHKGIYDGKTSADLKEEFNKSGKKWYEFRPKGGENYQDLLKRVEKFYHQMIIDNKPDDTILICSHDSWLVAFMFFFSGKPFDKSNKDEFKFNNTSITTLEIDGENHKVIKLNDIDHLK
jgi:broad specificity phosphatase PhoE